MAGNIFAPRIPLSSFTKESGRQLCAFASDLGWKPGYRPFSIEVPGIGNGNDFEFQPDLSSGAEWKFKQYLGCVYVTIFND